MRAKIAVISISTVSISTMRRKSSTLYGLTTVDKRKDYGEVRKITIGRIGKSICVVVYTEHNETKRIISARKANVRERRKYDEFIESAKNEED